MVGLDCYLLNNIPSWSLVQGDWNTLASTYVKHLWYKFTWHYDNTEILFWKAFVWCVRNSFLIWALSAMLMNIPNKYAPHANYIQGIVSTGFEVLCCRCHLFPAVPLNASILIRCSLLSSGLVGMRDCVCICNDISASVFRNAWRTFKLRRVTITDITARYSLMSVYYLEE